MWILFIQKTKQQTKQDIHYTVLKALKPLGGVAYASCYIGDVNISLRTSRIVNTMKIQIQSVCSWHVNALNDNMLTSMGRRL